MTTTDLALPEQLVDVRTGELLPATPDNAVSLLAAAREMRGRILSLVKDCEAVLLEEAKRQGTKTLHLDGGTATVSGGPKPEYDITILRELLDLGLPGERWDDLHVATISYKVDGRVVKQLEGANAEYAAVIARSRSYVDEPLRVSVK